MTRGDSGEPPSGFPDTEKADLFGQPAKILAPKYESGRRKAMKRLWNVRSVNFEAKRELYERVVVPTLMYGSEAWVMRLQERSKLDVMKMR